MLGVSKCLTRAERFGETKLIRGTWLTFTLTNLGNVRADTVKTKLRVTGGPLRTEHPGRQISWDWNKLPARILAPQEGTELNAPIYLALEDSDYGRLQNGELFIALDITVEYADELKERTPTTYHGIYIEGRGIQQA